MTIPLIERTTRAFLPLIRWMQTAFPPGQGDRFLAYSLPKIRLNGVARETVSAGGVPCEWLIPRDNPTDRALLYLHGGGFVFGQTPPHLQLGAALARKTGMRILMVDYRLAPQFPYPAALEDCLAAWRWLVGQGYPPRALGVAGDSAGGNLTLTLVLQLRALGEPLPAAAACLSPVTDLGPKQSRRERFKDPLLPPKAVRFYTEAYLGGQDPRDPLISPVYADLRGLPPLLVHAGEDEILLEDAERIVRLAKDAGVEARLEVYPRMWHVWQLFQMLPQAVASIEAIAGFLDGKVGEEALRSKGQMAIHPFCPEENLNP